MLWYLFGFAVGAGVLGAVWWLLRKRNVRFTWRGTEWMVGLLAAALLAGCASAPQDVSPAGARASRPPLSDASDAAKPGSAANPIHYRDPVLEALLARPWSTAKAIAPEAAEPDAKAAKPQATQPQKPCASLWGAYFWRRAGFDLGVACGAAGFTAAWWLFLKKAV